MLWSGDRKCLTSDGSDLRQSVTQSVPLGLMFPTHLTEQPVAGISWIFFSAHLKPFFTTHCALHRRTFGCIFSHVDRYILHCSFYVPTQKHLHRCTQRGLDPKHPLSVTAGILGLVPGPFDQHCPASRSELRCLCGAVPALECTDTQNRPVIHCTVAPTQ